MKVLILAAMLTFASVPTFAMESIQQKLNDGVDEAQRELCIDKLETIQKWGNAMKHEYFKFLYKKWADQCPTDLNEKYKLNY